MRQVKVEALTHEAFAPFGQFYSFADPQGMCFEGEIHQFFPDRLVSPFWGNVGFSPLLVKKPERMIIKQHEFHTSTPEMVIGLNDDMILHVAPPSAGTPMTHVARAFLVPKNTLVKMNTAVWHMAPLPVHTDCLSAMVILPERTYFNDCTVVDLTEDEQFEILL